ncbi:MAG: nucleotidyl transferase AbiEii/AbiGii toxin family protein, partial [Candidatus Micrarchaeota archaeon]
MLYNPTTVEQLAKEIAKEVSIKEDKIGYVEKDIWLTCLLKQIYNLENASKELAFKGGTCIVKCHYTHYRFSEDLDFTWIGKKENKRTNRKYFKEKYINKLVSTFGLGLERTAEIKDGVKHSHSGKILNYFLTLPTSDTRIQVPKIKITVSFDEVLKFPLQTTEVKPLSISDKKKNELFDYFGNIAIQYFEGFPVSAYSKEEIVCEKVRALLTRKERINRSRDIIDIFYLS